MKNKVNIDLKKFIMNKILPEYELNDKGHNIKHIEFVLNRAYELSENYDINYDMLYTIVCFHDIACHIDRDMHEMLSAKRMHEEQELRKFFNEEELLIMKEAIEDHRASLEYVPRNIYGKILSSADRKIGVEDYLRSSMGFSLKKNPNIADDLIIEESYQFAIKKFGKNGYARTKMYVDDKKYTAFLGELEYLIEHKEEYINKAKDIIKDIK